MYGIFAETGGVAQAIFTAEALKAFVTNFFGLVTANLPVILPIAGTMFGLSWVLRRANKAKRGSL